MSSSYLFILGAGFSRYAGMPLVQQLRECVLEWLKGPGISDPHVRVHLGPLSNWPEYPVGKFLAGLRCVDPADNRGFEEWMADLLKVAGQEPACVQTYHVLRYACAKVLWDKQMNIGKLPDAYIHFARKVHRGLGVVSFNWDLICERALEDAGRPWGYSANDPTPVVKPHGSLNWTRWADSGRTPYNSRDFAPIARECALTYNPARPFEDPLSGVFSDEPRYMTFPGDLESIDPTEHPRAAAAQDRLWTDTRKLIARADTVVFIGYSLPLYDAVARSQFQVACAGKSIVACNPSPDVLSEFTRVFGSAVVELIPKKFEESRFAEG